MAATARSVMIMMARGVLFPVRTPKKSRHLSLAQWLCPHPLSLVKPGGNDVAVYTRCGKCRLRLSYQDVQSLTPEERQRNNGVSELLLKESERKTAADFAQKQAAHARAAQRKEAAASWTEGGYVPMAPETQASSSSTPSRGKPSQDTETARLLRSAFTELGTLMQPLVNVTAQSSQQLGELSKLMQPMAESTLKTSLQMEHMNRLLEESVQYQKYMMEQLQVMHADATPIPSMELSPETQSLMTFPSPDNAPPSPDYAGHGDMAEF